MNNKQLNICRIKIAKVLDVPPDDVDIYCIIDCLDKAVKKIDKSKYNPEIVIDPKTKREKDAMFKFPGNEVLNAILCGEYPFEEYYEEMYNKYFKFINGRDID